MVINMDEAKLRTVAQLKEFLNATQEVKFTGVSGQDDQQRY
jgi:phosphate starvation-inducible protein PhoH